MELINKIWIEFMIFFSQFWLEFSSQVWKNWFDFMVKGGVGVMMGLVFQFFEFLF